MVGVIMDALFLPAMLIGFGVSVRQDGIEAPGFVSSESESERANMALTIFVLIGYEILPRLWEVSHP